MAKGFGKVAEAMAHLAAGVGGGYGKGRLEVAMQEREAYQQRLKEERASVAQQEERGWRTEEAEKEREHDFAKMEKAQEFDAESQDRTLQNQLTLAKMRGSGKGGSSSGGITRTITDADGKVWGITKTGEKIDLEIQGKAGSTSSGGGGKESSYMVRAREQEMLDSKTEGRSFDEANVARNYKAISGGRSSAASDEVTGKDYLKRKAELRDSLTNLITGGKAGREFSKLPPEEQEKYLDSKLRSEYGSVGMKVPFGQESQEEVAQPGVIPAPATSTNGEKPTDATPKGSGSETSPYIVETPEQAEWVRKNAKGGSVIRDVLAGQVVRKPKDPEEK